jgi:hypothetical protein
MPNLNELVCAADVANTGYGNCYLDMQQIIGAILVPNGYKLTAAELQTLSTTLAADAKVVNKLNRIYPVGGFLQITDNSEDKTIQTFGYGGKKVTKEGSYDWSFQFTEGGLCLLKALRSFNSNGKWSVLFYDSNFVLFGTTGSEAGALYGIPTEMIWAAPWKPNDGTNTAMYMIQFNFQPRYINDALGYFQADSTLAEVTGLQDITLTKNTWVEATGVANVTVASTCGTNLGEVYPTELAAAGVWTAVNANTGAAITITSVAYVSATKTFNVTIDTTDPDFPAGTQGILLNLAANSVLEAASIIGFESAGALTLPTTA